MERADHLVELRFDELGEFGGELSGGDVRLSAPGLLHDSLMDKGSGFFKNAPGLSFVYKDSTNFRAAHTPATSKGEMYLPRADRRGKILGGPDRHPRPEDALMEMHLPPRGVPAVAPVAGADEQIEAE